MGKRNNRKKSSLEEQRRESQKRKSDKNLGLAKNNLGEYRVLLTNPIELKKEKLSWWSKVKSELTIIISLIAVAISLFSVYNTYKKNSYLETTNFNIIQNLWQEHPSYTLYNESQKPLTSPPHQSYYMYIPTMVQRDYADGEQNNFLILLPVSYESVESQILSGKTIDEIEKSTLPQNFYAKKGMRDLRETRFKVDNTQSNKKDELKIRTYPFLVIATEIRYSYKDKPNKTVTERFLSTAVRDRINLSGTDFNDLENCTRNMAKYSANEVTINNQESIYDTAHNYLVSEYKFFLTKNDKSDSNHFINSMILAGINPDSSNLTDRLYTKDFSELLSEPDSTNFNPIMYKLVNKFHILPQDPLVPNY